MAKRDQSVWSFWESWLIIYLIVILLTTEKLFKELVNKILIGIFGSVTCFSTRLTFLLLSTNSVHIKLAWSQAAQLRMLFCIENQ